MNKYVHAIYRSNEIFIADSHRLDDYKSIPQRVDIRYFSYSSLANVSFYLSTASFLTSRSNITSTDTFIPISRTCKRRESKKSKHKCLSKSVNSLSVQNKPGKKNLMDRFNDHWFHEELFETFLEVVIPSCIRARVRILSSKLARRISTDVYETETGSNNRSKKK